MRRKRTSIDWRQFLEQTNAGKIFSPRDTEGEALCPGLFARPRGRKVLWLLRYRVGEKQRELVLGHVTMSGSGPLADALNGDFAGALARSQGVKEPINPSDIGHVARRVRSMIDAGQDPVALRQGVVAAAKRNRFGDLAPAFLELGVKKGGLPLRPATLKEYRRALLDHARPLHDKPVHDIDRRMIADLIRAIVKEHGRITSARSRAALSRFFNWCAGEGLLNFGNPVTGTMRHANEERERVLSDDELRRLWAATDDKSAHSMIVRLLIWTGARRSEVGGITVEELTPEGWLLPRGRAKNGQEQPQDAIARWRASGARPQHLFGRVRGRPFSGWSKAKHDLDQRMGLAAWTLHDIRRTVRTNLGRLRVEPHVAERVLNHRPPKLARTYDRHSYLGEKARALQLWADDLDRIIGAPPPARVVPFARAG